MRSPATTPTFAALADRLGFGEQFTEGRSAREWLVHMYEKWSAEIDFAVPDFDRFWADGVLRLPVETGLTLIADFRADPGTRLANPRGRIEIFSDTIAGFGLPDCAGHPGWYPPSEWLGSPRAERFPLHLIANQPAESSQPARPRSAQRGHKVHGREPAAIHPSDASLA